MAATDVGAALARFRDNSVQGGAPSIDGRHMKLHGHVLSMAGNRRLEHTAALLDTVVNDGIPGHFMETGVFRGGMSFLAAKTLEMLGSKAEGRRVYLADSFVGLPDLSKYSRAGSTGADDTHKLDMQERTAHRIGLLNANSLASVQSSAKKIGVDMNRLRWVPGYFNESLPRLLKEDGEQLHLSVLRLDGDSFASTFEAIELLYPHLSPGGFLVVDDFVDWPSCREAVDLYRRRHHIAEPITLIPHRPGEVQRGAYWRKQPSATQSLCVGKPIGSMRLKGSYNPGRLVPLTQPGQPVNISGAAWGLAYLKGVVRSAEETLYKCIDSAEGSEAPP